MHTERNFSRKCLPLSCSPDITLLYFIVISMLTRTPIEIIKSASVAADSIMLAHLIEIMQSIYKYELFKPIMDISATLAKEGRLKFIAEPKEFYMLDEGNCVTIEGGAFDRFSNIFRSSKKYTITIKKLSYDVVVHEIGHMVEKESGIPLDAAFRKAIYDDISVKHSHNVSLNAAIKQVMVDEVAPYEDSHKLSELFTRFFQLLAMSKQVSGFAAQYGYKVEDIYVAFPNFTKWLGDVLYPNLIKRIDPQIAQSSQAYIIPIEHIKHEWAKERVRSVHGHTSSASEKQPTRFSRNIKSIKD